MVVPRAAAFPSRMFFSNAGARSLRAHRQSSDARRLRGPAQVVPGSPAFAGRPGTPLGVKTRGNGRKERAGRDVPFRAEGLIFLGYSVRPRAQG